MKIVLALLFVLACAVTAPCFATTRTASSCSAANIQTQINASSDGDTVNVPAGTCTWSSSDVVSWTDKVVNLIGAGIGQTIINAPRKFVYITVSNPAKAASRVSGFTIQGITVSDYVIAIASAGQTGPISGWRIDHIAFNLSVGAGIPIFATGISYGLVDHCTFTGTGEGWGQIEIDGYLDSEYNQLPTLMGDGYWSMPFNLGTNQAVYVEDCTFTFNASSSGAINYKYGGDVVFRHNTVNGTMFQTHAARTGDRGGRKIEIYNNVFNGTISGGNFLRPTFLRSGTGVIFNNKITGYSSNLIHVDNERTGPVSWDYSLGPPLVRCDGSHPTYDGNDGTGNQVGWPCLDQIGRVGAYPNQTSVPLYTWMNGAQSDCATNQATCTGDIGVFVANDGDLGGGHPYMSDHIQSGRDYVNNGITPKQGYVSYTYPHPLQGGQDSTAPMVTAFVIPATSSTLLVPITTFTATDAVGVTGYCVNESATPPTSGSCSGSGWAGSAQSSYTFTTPGSKTLYAWAKDAAGNISESANDGVIITLPARLGAGVTMNGIRWQ